MDRPLSILIGTVFLVGACAAPTAAAPSPTAPRAVEAAASASAAPASNVLEVTAFARKLVFALDVFQCLDRCDAVVLNLDGRVPDEGAVMEASLAWTANKPVVIYKTTFITVLGGLDNPMVSGLGMQWASVAKLEQLSGEVKRAMASYQPPRDDECTRGPHVDAVIKLGAAVWDRMDEVRTITDLEAEEIPAAVKAFRESLRDLLEAADLWDPEVPQFMQHTL